MSLDVKGGGVENWLKKKKKKQSLSLKEEERAAKDFMVNQRV